MSNIKIKIKGVEFKAWSTINVQRNFDSVDTLSVSYPFDPKNQQLKEIFKPLSYNVGEVYYGDKLVFKGLLLDVVSRSDANQTSEEATFYALSGNLIDCTFPGSLTTLQYDNQTIKTIFNQIADQFGLNIYFAADGGGSFDRVACSPDQKVFDFMVDLAKQRGLVISSLADGGILVRKGKTSGSLVATLKEGQPPIISITNDSDARSYYSELTTVTTGRQKTNINGKYTTKNNRLSLLRPLTQISRDTDTGSIKDASEGLAGRMYANAIKYQVEIPSWINSLKKIYETNTFVNITAPSVRIYNEYKFMIMKVDLFADADKEITSLKCVLPTAFTNKAPSSFPWD